MDTTAHKCNRWDKFCEQDLSMPISALHFCVDKVDFDLYFLFPNISVLPK